MALRMSRDAVDALIDGHRVKLVVDLKPALSEEVLRERIAGSGRSWPRRSSSGELLRKLVPQPLVMPLAHEIDVHGKTYQSKITDGQITRLIRTLKGADLPHYGLCPVRICRDDGRGRSMRRGEP